VAGVVIRLRENLRALFYAPFYLAHELDLFARVGVEVGIEESDDPLDTAAQLLAGEVDVCWGGPLRVLRILDEEPGAGLVCFGEVVGRDPFFVVARDDELANLRLGVVSEVVTPWICLAQDLVDRGVDPAEIDIVAGQTMAENLAAFEAGELGGFQSFQPYAERAVRTGDHVVLAAADRGPTAYTCLYSTRERVDQCGRELTGVAEALRWSVAQIYAQPGRASFDAIAPRWFPDLDPELAGAALDRYRMLELYNRTGVLSREGFDRLQRAMLSAGFVHSHTPYDDCVIVL